MGKQPQAEPGWIPDLISPPVLRRQSRISQGVTGAGVLCSSESQGQRTPRLLALSGENAHECYLHWPPVTNQMRKRSKARAHLASRKERLISGNHFVHRKLRVVFQPQDWRTLWDQTGAPAAGCRAAACRAGKEQLWSSLGLGDMQKSRQVGGLKAPITAQPQGMNLRNGTR